MLEYLLKIISPSFLGHKLFLQYMLFRRKREKVGFIAMKVISAYFNQIVGLQ